MSNKKEEKVVEEVIEAMQEKKSSIQEKSQQFVNEYNDLCKKFKLQISFEPRWVQSKDTGDYRLQIVAGITELITQE